MKIFISWSGKDTISYKVALALQEWLPTLVQCIDPWISSEILSGDRWNEQINLQLADSLLGIICVTQENKDAPWLNFEAGAIAKGLTNNKVIPLLINLKPSDISGPLAQFQSKSLTKDDIHKIVLDLNSLCERQIDKDRLEKLFNKMWDDFADQIALFQKSEPQNKKGISRRSPEDIIEELLLLTRDMRIEISSLTMRLDTLGNRSYIGDGSISPGFEHLFTSIEQGSDTYELSIFFLNLIKQNFTRTQIINAAQKRYGLTASDSSRYLDRFISRSNIKPKKREENVDSISKE
jgi:hypothetical protein